ncbi:hypothetical protein [Arthrobacter sp. ZGTC212]|nr:hypothetical protein [Arthrobacter sp. ZGTC212]
MTQGLLIASAASGQMQNGAAGNQPGGAVVPARYLAETSSG